MKDYFNLTDEEKKQLADERNARPRPAKFGKSKETTTTTTTTNQ